LEVRRGGVGTVFVEGLVSHISGLKRCPEIWGTRDGMTDATEKQIPCGNDSKKNKSKDKRNCKSNCRSRFPAGMTERRTKTKAKTGGLGCSRPSAS
jgi:hypothetical protein